MDILKGWFAHVHEGILFVRGIIWSAEKSLLPFLLCYFLIRELCMKVKFRDGISTERKVPIKGSWALGENFKKQEACCQRRLLTLKAPQTSSNLK